MRSVPRSRSRTRHGDAVAILLEREHLGAVAQRRAELECAVAQDRLEHVLVDEDSHRRAVALHSLVQVMDIDRDLATGQRLDGDDPPARAVGLERLRADPLLKSELPHDLKRPHLKVPSTRVDRRAGMTLQHQRRDAVVTEQRRSRQADETAADDQDGNIVHPPDPIATGCESGIGSYRNRIRRGRPIRVADDHRLKRGRAASCRCPTAAARSPSSRLSRFPARGAGKKPCGVRM